MSATKLADWIHTHLRDADRGVIQVGEHFVLFSNGELSDPATIGGMSFVLRWLFEREHEVLGLASNCERANWVIVVRPNQGCELIGDRLRDVAGEVMKSALNDLLFDGHDFGRNAKALQEALGWTEEQLGQYRREAKKTAAKTIAAHPLPKTLAGWVENLPSYVP